MTQIKRSSLHLGGRTPSKVPATVPGHRIMPPHGPYLPRRSYTTARMLTHAFPCDGLLKLLSLILHAHSRTEQASPKGSVSSSAVASSVPGGRTTCKQRARLRHQLYPTQHAPCVFCVQCCAGSEDWRPTAKVTAKWNAPLCFSAVWASQWVFLQFSFHGA